MSSPVLAQAVKSKTQCKPADARLTYNCTVTLTLDGKPVTGADITVKADMPAMPMAHNVKPVPAKAMHHADGQYNFEIELEMFGEWRFTYDLAMPFRDRLGEKIMFSSGDPNEMKMEKRGAHIHN